MSRSIACFVFAAAISIFAGAACAQAPALDTLLAQADQLGRDGKYQQAIDAAAKALASAEQAFGPNDVRLLKPLKALGRLYELQHSYAQAQTEYQRALTILEGTGALKSAEAAELKLSLLSIASRVSAAPEPAAAGPNAEGRSARSARTRSFAPQAAPPPPPLTTPRGMRAGAIRLIPVFPWPPPAPSASYVFPQQVFSSYSTVGQVTAAILSALEQSGYVERSFFQTEQGGVALVTRLERIAGDGSSAPDPERWPPGFNNNSASFVDFIRGLFYAKAGHYRVIVFVLQEASFTPEDKLATGKDAEKWLREGAIKLPPELARRAFGRDSTCTALIYEFESDGSAVKTVVSALTGKQHLEKAGLLAALARPQ